MRRFALFILLSTISLTALASNLNFLKDSPISSFDNTDTKLMTKTMYEALNTLKDGDKLAWKNDKTGNSGLSSPTKSYEEHGKTCRSLRMVNRSKKAVSESVHEFCKGTNNKWELYIEPQTREKE